VAYAVADKLGFAKDKVAWTVVPFTNAFAPGAKTFDFLINQVSYKPERAEAVDLSEGYYNLNQGVVALKDNPVAKAKTLADLKAYKFGAMVGTTSYDAIQKVIVPTTQGEADRRAGRGPADGQLQRDRPDRGRSRDHRRPARAVRGHARVLQPAHGEGQRPHRVRERGGHIPA
jgi:hypothetical protein